MRCRNGGAVIRVGGKEKQTVECAMCVKKSVTRGTLLVRVLGAFFVTVGLKGVPFAKP